MAKKDKGTDTTEAIDLQGWITQAEYSRKHGYKLNTISRWVKRAREGEGKQKIQYLDVPALGITLVKPL
jgi:hypothetical protein